MTGGVGRKTLSTLACLVSFASTRGGQLQTASNSSLNVTHASYSGRVTGLPFEAEFKGIYAGPEGHGPITLSGRIYRDSEGRSRSEYTLSTNDADQDGDGPEAPQAIVITDPFAGATFLLDEGSKHVIVIRHPSPGVSDEAASVGWSFSGVEHIEESADRREIEGLQCRKILIRLAGGESGEIWVSDDLKEEMLEEIGKQCTWQLFNVRRVEPDAELFAVPPDYQEVKPPEAHDGQP